MRCLDTVASYLFYIFLVDFSLEMLDLVHRIYEADESFRTLDFMVHTQPVYFPGRASDCMGTLAPVAFLPCSVFPVPEKTRRRIYTVAEA